MWRAEYESIDVEIASWFESGGMFYDYYELRPEIRMIVLSLYRLNTEADKESLVTQARQIAISLGWNMQEHYQ